MTMIYVARYLHLQIRGKVELERANNCYKHTQERVVESESFRVLRDFINGQCDKVVESRRPDIIFLDKQAREAQIIDIVNPGDWQVKDKELEKKGKSQILRKNLGKLWKLKKLMVVLKVIAALEAVSDMFEKYTWKLNFAITLEVIEKKALLGTAELLRKVFPYNFCPGSQHASSIKQHFFVFLFGFSRWKHSDLPWFKPWPDSFCFLFLF